MPPPPLSSSLSSLISYFISPHQGRAISTPSSCGMGKWPASGEIVVSTTLRPTPQTPRVSLSIFAPRLLACTTASIVTWQARSVDSRWVKRCALCANILFPASYMLGVPRRRFVFHMFSFFKRCRSARAASTGGAILVFRRDWGQARKASQRTKTEGGSSRSRR